MDKNDIKISFTILTHNETSDLKRLLEQIKTFKTVWDEVVIVDDYSDNQETKDLLEWAKTDSILQSKVFQNALNKDFAAQKNFADSKCVNDYIFNLDADEYLSDKFAESFREILYINQDVEYFRIPRLNKVEGITLQHITSWNWGISSVRTEIEDGIILVDSPFYKVLKQYNLIINESDGVCKYYTPIINHPDMQGRIYKRLPSIVWVNPVHEVVVGYKKYSNFPVDKKFSILHYKTVKKQEEQNTFYASMR